jgi:hypothetical protein
MRFLILASAALALAACGKMPAQSNSYTDNSMANSPGSSTGADSSQTPPATSQVGRFVIVHSPQIERDTVLLDTVTGKTWTQVELTDLEESPTAWEPMARRDDEGEMAILRARHPPKR